MKEPSTLSGREQLKVLSSPVRYAIYSCLRADGAATAKELATRLGKDELLLYYHLRRMAAHGILGMTQRPTATKPETVYEARGPFVIEEIDLDDDENLREVKRNLRSIFRRSAQELAEAAEELRNDFHRHVALSRMSVRLEPSQVEELQQKLAELRDWVQANEGSGELVALTLALGPIVERR